MIDANQRTAKAIGGRSDPGDIPLEVDILGVSATEGQDGEKEAGYMHSESK